MGKEKGWIAKTVGAVSALSILTVVYFIVELLINTSIVGQLGISSDALIAETMELWGKIIAGIGLALMVTRYRWPALVIRVNKPSVINKEIYKDFLKICLITIPLSYVAQEALIYHVVHNSSDEDRNKAILISATHGTVVPFYVPKGDSSNRYDINEFVMLGYPVSRFITGDGHDYWKSKKHEAEWRQECTDASATTLQIENKTQKVFFQYKALLSNFDEDLYKQVVKDHYSCSLDDNQYLRSWTAGTLDQSHLLYEAYEAIYKPAITEYERKEKYARGSQKAEMNKKWREYMDEQYGFKTTIKPDTSYQKMFYFFKHPDTRRLYAEKTGIKDIYPEDADFRDKARAKLKKDLPGLVIPAYISSTGERSEQSKELTDNEIAEQGKTAYKAIVMPMIALGLSAFFLILNVIAVINSAVQQHINNKRIERQQQKLMIRRSARIAREEHQNAHYENFGLYAPPEALPTHKKIKNWLNRFNILEMPLLRSQKRNKVRAFLNKHFEGYKWSGLTRNVSDFIDAPLGFCLRYLSLKAFFIAAMAWFLLWPTIQYGEEYKAFENTKFEQASKWLYYHESNLIEAYELPSKIGNNAGHTEVSEVDNQSIQNK